MKPSMSNNGYKEVNPVPDSYGSGLPFYVPERYTVLHNDHERQQPIVIDLSDLNGSFGMPHNFHKKAGRIVPSYDRYWTAEEFTQEVNWTPDIE